MGLERCKNGHIFSKRTSGNICPYCNTSVKVSLPGEENPQSEYIEEDVLSPEKLEFVTGWLVCVSGPPKGKDYRIVANKNFIGRASGMDIRVPEDDKIEERNHAVILYDPENNETVIKESGGDGKGLIHVPDENGELKKRVVNEEPLTLGKRIKMGQSEFIFVPFCSKGEGMPLTYQWE